MSDEHFQIKYEKIFDKTISKRDFSKIYLQQGANLNDSGKNNDFIFGEKNKYYQIGYA